MKKILHIISSAMGEASNSTLLGSRIVAEATQRFPGSTVTVNNVAEKGYASFKPVHLQAYKMPADSYMQEHRDALRDSDAAVGELQEADIVVISLPLYNFNLPPALKAWVDHIVRPGITFSYATGRPEGLLRNKKAYLAIASNGVYSEGPMKPFDFSEPYLRYILGFVGIEDVTTYRIEGAGIDGVKETAVEKGLQSVAV